MDQQLDRTTGVYAIRNLKTGRTYVGGSTCVYWRWMLHRSALRNNRHHCPLLQADWQLFGEDAFAFSILEVVERPSLSVAEQAWADRLREAGGIYNARRSIAVLRSHSTGKAGRPPTKKETGERG